MSRIGESTGKRVFGKGRGSNTLMPTTLSKHLHFVLDFGRRHADAMGGADIGCSPRVTEWME